MSKDIITIILPRIVIKPLSFNKKLTKMGINLDEI